MTLVSNFLDSPDGCKHSLAVFSLRHLLGLSHQGKVRRWVLLLASSASLDRRHRRAQIWPQMFTNLWCAQPSSLCSSSFPFLPIHHFRLFPHTLLYRAVHTRRADSFVLKFWGRSTVQNHLQFPICRFPNWLRPISTKRPCD